MVLGQMAIIPFPVFCKCHKVLIKAKTTKIKFKDDWAGAELCPSQNSAKITYLIFGTLPIDSEYTSCQHLNTFNSRCNWQQILWLKHLFFAISPPAPLPDSSLFLFPQSLPPLLSHNMPSLSHCRHFTFTLALTDLPFSATSFTFSRPLFSMFPSLRSSATWESLTALLFRESIVWKEITSLFPHDTHYSMLLEMLVYCIRNYRKHVSVLAGISN